MPDLSLVFTELRKVLVPYADRLVVARDDDRELYLNTSTFQKNKTPLFFGAVQIKKAYVSYHLMPVYLNPDLLMPASKELLSRMQGKSCFNFKGVEPERFAELAALTQAGFKHWEAQGIIPPP